MKREINQIRQDLKHLSSTEFEKKYPGVKAEKLKGLSDADLEKVAGGVTSSDGVFRGIYYQR